MSLVAGLAAQALAYEALSQTAGIGMRKYALRSREFEINRQYQINSAIRGIDQNTSQRLAQQQNLSQYQQSIASAPYTANAYERNYQMNTARAALQHGDVTAVMKRSNEEAAYKRNAEWARTQTGIDTTYGDRVADYWKNAGANAWNYTGGLGLRAWDSITNIATLGHGTDNRDKYTGTRRNTLRGKDIANLTDEDWAAIDPSGKLRQNVKIDGNQAIITGKNQDEVKRNTEAIKNAIDNSAVLKEQKKLMEEEIKYAEKQAALQQKALQESLQSNRNIAARGLSSQNFVQTLENQRIINSRFSSMDQIAAAEFNQELTDKITENERKYNEYKNTTTTQNENGTDITNGKFDLNEEMKKYDKETEEIRKKNQILGRPDEDPEVLKAYRKRYEDELKSRLNVDENGNRLTRQRSETELAIRRNRTDEENAVAERAFRNKHDAYEAAMSGARTSGLSDSYDMLNEDLLRRGDADNMLQLIRSTQNLGSIITDGLVAPVRIIVAQLDKGVPATVT